MIVGIGDPISHRDALVKAGLGCGHWQQALRGEIADDLTLRFRAVSIDVGPWIDLEFTDFQHQRSYLSSILHYLLNHPRPPKKTVRNKF